MEDLVTIDESAWYLEIGQRIKTARNDNKLTQQELADKAGLKRTSITNIEKGIQKTPVYTIYVLSVILNKSFYELLPEIQTGSKIIVGGKETTATPKSLDIIEEILNSTGNSE